MQATKENAFYLGETPIYNLEELADHLQHMDQSTYDQFAGVDFNYFADWVGAVMQNNTLAQKMRGATSKDEAFSLVKKEIQPKQGPLFEDLKQEVQNEQAKHPEHLNPPRHDEKEHKEHHTTPPHPHKHDHHDHHEHQQHQQHERKNNEHHDSKSDKEVMKKYDHLIEKTPDPKNHKRVDVGNNTDELLKGIARNEREIKEFLWKHFGWDMAKEFMYGLAIGILVGFILSKMFIG